VDPGPRYIKQGDDSGEFFYHSILNDEFYSAISNDQKLIVNLDGPNGYASSFLDESFGNLVYDFGYEEVINHIEFISKEEPEWITMLKNETFKEWEERRLSKDEPQKTSPHSEWWRKTLDGKLVKNIWINP
jgi:hypothetical protein